MEHSQLEALKARLAELEREKAALRTHIKTISELPEGFSVTSGRQGPRLRAPAVPEEWLEMHPERVANLPRGAEVLTRAGRSSPMRPRRRPGPRRTLHRHPTG